MVIHSINAAVENVALDMGTDMEDLTMVVIVNIYGGDSEKNQHGAAVEQQNFINTTSGADQSYQNDSDNNSGTIKR